jgi:hypothetical protein
MRRKLLNLLETTTIGKKKEEKYLFYLIKRNENSLNILLYKL